MKKAKIKLDFLRMSNAAFEKKATLIATSMKGNANFPNPMPSLDVLNAVVDQFVAIALTAQTHDRIKIAERDVIRGKLEALLVQQSNYVAAIANGDKAIILSAGYTATNGTGSGKGSGKGSDSIDYFNIEQGDISGQLAMSVNKVRGAATYSFYCAIAGTDNPVWKVQETTKTNVTMSGLEPGKTYLCYVKAVRAKGKTIQCDVITKMVF